MGRTEKQGLKQIAAPQSIAFETAEEAWFWFIQAQQARNDGARFVAGQGALPRPCEPVDILKILDRLYRKRFLLRDHLLVLRHYGRRRLAPDPSRIKEARAYGIWCEALDRLGATLERKNIVKAQGEFCAAPLSILPFLEKESAGLR